MVFCPSPVCPSPVKRVPIFDLEARHRAGAQKGRILAQDGVLAAVGRDRPLASRTRVRDYAEWGFSDRG